MSGVLVRMDVKNSTNNMSKVLWHMAINDADAQSWVTEMEFEHIEMASELSIAKDGLKFSEVRYIPVSDLSNLRVAELGQMTLGDLMSVFTQMSLAQQAQQAQYDSIEAPARPAPSKVVVKSKAPSPTKNKLGLKETKESAGKVARAKV